MGMLRIIIKKNKAMKKVQIANKSKLKLARKTVASLAQPAANAQAGEVTTLPIWIRTLCTLTLECTIN
jgi:hypothetical protein